MWRFKDARAGVTNSAPLSQRSLRLRYRDGHRRIPRPPPASALPAVPAGIHKQAGIRKAGACRASGSGGQLRRGARCRQRGDEQLPSPASQYVLPFAARSRFLFKMDFAELEYISRLRSGVKGQFLLPEDRLGNEASARRSGHAIGRSRQSHAALGARSAAGGEHAAIS